MGTVAPQTEPQNTVPQGDNFFQMDRLHAYSAQQLRDFLYTSGLAETDYQAIERLCKTRALAEELIDSSRRHHPESSSHEPEHTPDPDSEPDSDYPRFKKHRKGFQVTTVSKLKRGGSLLSYRRWYDDCKRAFRSDPNRFLDAESRH